MANPHTISSFGVGDHLDLSAGEVVYCHECENEWYRSEGGLVCPRCSNELTEIVDAELDPRSWNGTSDVPDELQTLGDHRPRPDESLNKALVRSGLGSPIVASDQHLGIKFKQWNDAKNNETRIGPRAVIPGASSLGPSLSSTISKDITGGQGARNATLLKEFGKKNTKNLTSWSRAKERSTGRPNGTLGATYEEDGSQFSKE